MSDSGSSVSQSDIAIIGMALRVPGANSVEEYWQNLRGGVESIETRTPEQLIEAGENPEKIRHKNYVPRTAALSGFAEFDAEFFGFSPKEAAIMDPQHRQFLECAWEALEDSTRPPARINGPVGVFAGCGMGSYFYFNVLSHRSLVENVGLFLLRHTGNDKDFLATRASYLFDLHGPSINVQTACSTSLVAVHQACQSLLNGECEMALAGGVTIELPHRRGYVYQEGEILSTDGHCRSFDHRASGTVFGSGAGVVVLRRLADAIADGDPIHAVIKGSAVNNDGASKAGYLAPSVTGQAEAIVEAQAIAGVDAESIGYVECHGTGTYLGDPIEIEALTQAFRQTTNKTGFCRVGSVKSNIGHLDTAAGVASLIKAVLAVKNGEIPPTLGFEKPNPAIPFATSPFVVADRLTDWPSGPAPRRAGVNSLGVGGTNAHIIVEEPPRLKATEARTEAGPHVLVLTAKNRNALDDGGRRLARHLDANPDALLQDVAHTLLDGRRHFEHRRVVAVSNRADAIGILAEPDKHRVFTHTPVEGTADAVFMFPGGGAQYPHMARSLYRDEAAFRRIVDEGLSYLPAAASQEIREIWLATDGPTPGAAERFLRPSLQLPAILIVEVAIARLWMSWGVKPTALIGHSMGENAAACIAGVLSYERAVNLVRLRGELFEEISPGGMLSVALGAAALKLRLPDDLDLASVNAPELCVVSGANSALEAFREALAADDIDASRIPIDIAAHSRMLAPILERFEAFLKATPLSTPRIPIVSNLTGTWLTADEAQDATYWTRHLRSTVRFGDGLGLLAQTQSRVFIEVGPGRVLGSLAKAQGIPANQVINSLPHADETLDDRLFFLTAVGRAWAVGLDVPLDRLTIDTAPRRVNLPPYAFQHETYFLERIAPSSAAESEASPVKLPDMANWGWEPVWKQASPDVRIDAADTPASWLIFLDGSPLGDTLAHRLRELGHEVATVSLGDTFGVVAPGNYVLCPEHGREGYDALLNHLAAERGLPQRIVHLWLLTHDESFRPGSSFFHRNIERGFLSLLWLGQALSEIGATEPLQITAVTNGMQRVGNEAVRYPEKATLLGPAQVLPREMPNVSVRVVDLPLSPDARLGLLARERARLLRYLANASADNDPEDVVFSQLWDDLLAANGSEIAAYRRGRRWVLGFAPLTLDDASQGETAFRERGVYLITGGLGELATACAEDLAQRFKARLVLIGRTELPDREEWRDYLAAFGTRDKIGRAIAAIERIEAAGGEVMIAKADITNSEAMRTVVTDAKARFGAIHGVLHAAGVVKDDLIALKNPTDIEDVFAPKIHGTLVLADVLADEPLDVMVLFSSTSTDTAPAGQVDYVAANAFLNAFAETRSGAPGRTLALHWGIWKNVGLAARAIAAAEHQDAAPKVEPARTPLFDRRLSSARSDWLESRLASTRQWVLDEHRLKSGHAIWPGTGYIEFAAEALAEHDIGGPFEIEDLTFLRPLHVPDETPLVARVTLAKDGDGYMFAVESERGIEGATTPLRHAEARVSAFVGPRPARIDIAQVLASCSQTTHAAETGLALKSAQDGNLKFGPRWQVLRSVALGQGEAIARLALDDAFKTDLDDGFLVHPALLDIATGYAMDLIPNYDPGAGLWVPMTYGRIRVFGTLPASLWSHARLNTARELGADYATFDVTVTDDAGQVLVAVNGFTVRRLPANIDLAASLSTEAEGAAATRAPAGGTELSPALQRLAAQVDQGILPEDGFEALLRAVGTGKSQVIVSSIDLAALRRAAARVDGIEAASTTFERPNLGVDFIEPTTDVEKTLAGFWSELLGVKAIGTQDNFFDLGGHSLIAVRLFRMIKAAYAVDFPISVLFEAPTIAQCAALIEETSPKAGEPTGKSATVTALDRPKLRHVVRMDAGKETRRTPFFLAAGMFGNILNLRHLAVHIGTDRPVYGLQARGIYGGEAPHETFEETARDYLAEIRTVQPEGPYLIGGFSGGGLVAYEMAQQLRKAGEKTALVVLLDTPYPADVPLSIQDRILMKLQDMEREGVAFFGNWARRRIAWERRRMEARRRPESPKSAEQFHNEELEAAFRRALSRYRGQPYGEPVLLMRPKQDVRYRVTGNRALNEERALLLPDNGWAPYAASLSVQEVPGDHDSMVLEPHVRVMASRLREALASADRGPSSRPIAAE
ncbi:polyketide synthase [Hyphomicrobium nitrativorans NL23]|uniref:Phenolphthiocerol/phthiocerol polyketide synthase subunit E n=1 Tax=Hyphomicrobium nitrativorans NL23 TaxID=1029756 RepID=V5SBD6_9HYPH|nr:type I polyketide synthase [Hyphomicrobium nitrativorans]AHB47828.1 polyketide synthase [Hyphomicrobium nitrativorans NL23]